MPTFKRLLKRLDRERVCIIYSQNAEKAYIFEYQNVFYLVIQKCAAGRQREVKKKTAVSN